MAGNPLSCEIKGRYRSGYGFELHIPAGLRACNGWHRGWMIPLGKRTEDRYVTFGCGPNSSDMSEVGVESWASELIESFLIEPDRQEARLISRKSIRLGEEPAVRFVIRFRPAGAVEDVVEENVTAFRAGAEGDAVDSYHFGLDLTTIASQYERDRATFNAILRSWVFIGAPLP